MTSNAIQKRSVNFTPVECPDWFDHGHDPVLILQERDYEENGLSPRPQVHCYVA